MALDIDVSSPAHIRVRFTLDDSHPPGEVSVVGSFNNGTPGLDALTPDHDGTRSVVLGLAYGERHVFRYLGPGTDWFDERDADQVTAEGSVLERAGPVRSHSRSSWAGDAADQATCPCRGRT